MTRRDLVKILIDLSGRSASSLASEIGVFRGAVLTWLKRGDKSIGIGKQDDLLSILGISNGSLDSTRVHQWTTGHNLEPLREILAWSGEKFVAVFLVKDSVAGQICLLAPSKSIRILVRQNFSPMVPASEIQFPGHETIPLVNWLEDESTTNLPWNHPSLFKKILDSNNQITPEEFDRFFESVKKSGNFADPQNLPEALTPERLKEIRARAEDGSVDSGVLREDIRSLLDHIEFQEGK